MEFELHFNKDNKEPKKGLNLRVFWLTFFAMFLLTSLKQLGVSLPTISFDKFSIIDPLSKNSSIFDGIEGKLEQVKNDYHLSKQSSFITSSYAATTNDYDNASAYALIDFDSGNIIAEKNLDKKVPIASLTKLMSAVVALDILSPTEQITVAKKATNIEPTRIGVKTGQKYTLYELLNAMLLTSANDAAEVVRDGIDAKYQQEVFIKAMNQKAQDIGLTNTHFANPQGFDNPQNYSTAHDLAILTHYALANYPTIAAIVSQDQKMLPATQTHPKVLLLNWNGLMDVYPNIFGVKIGNTDQAQTTTIVGSQRGGKKLLVVLLGAPTIIQRDLWASELLDLGYEQTLGLPPVSVNENELLAKYQSWYQ